MIGNCAVFHQNDAKEHNGLHGWMRCVQSRGRSAGRKEGRKTNVAVLRSDLAVMLDGYCVAYKHLGQTSTRFWWRHALANQERQYFMLIWSHTMTIAIVRVFVGGGGGLGYCVPVKGKGTKE